MDLSSAQRISISPGRVAVLTLPETIAETKVGAPSNLKAVISTTDPSELTLFWVARTRTQTNLIVRTTKRVFVFEIIPDLNRHQDYLKIQSAFGSPTTSNNSRVRTLKQLELAPLPRPTENTKIVMESKLQ